MPPPSEQRAHALSIAAYIRLAKGFIEDSRALAGRGSRNAATLLFQAVEAALLAVMTSERLDAGHRSTQHQIGFMADALPDENPLKSQFAALAHLTGYATTYRYPAPSGRIRAAPPSNQLAAWTASAQSLLNACVEGFGIDLSDPNSPARKLSPIRAQGLERMPGNR
jgi:hypothetical protein